MSDVLFESTRALVLCGLLLYLLNAGHKRSDLSRRGWRFIIAGFVLLLFASLLDISDNFSALDRFVFLGDTRTEAFLEKIIGFLGGFVLLAIGLVRWIPTIAGVERLERLRRIAEDADKAKSRFLASMSHELRTPLNGIMGMSQLLEEDAREAGDERTAAELSRIHSAGQHLLALIDDILDMSRLAAEKFELELVTVDLRPLVEEVVATVHPMAQENDDTIELRCAEDLGQLRCDPRRVRQILLNLLGNAIKFTRGGTIAVSAERHVEADQAWIHITVADDGIGMNEEQLSRVFDEFEQADASTTRKYGGTGLGLAICRRLCEIMGGWIDVTSQAGEGSTFEVALPAG
jgi:signal transduction histidine kinase